jgi:hypothetical protein
MANLIPFQSWADVLTYARTGQPLYYQAPMDHRATLLRPGAKTIFGFEVRAKTIRIWPSGSLGRGRSRTSDPFNADKGHLSRFSHPLENELPGRGGYTEHHRAAQGIFFRTRDAIEKQDAFTVSGMDAQITILKDAIRQMSPYAGHKYDTPGRITHGWSVAGAPEWMHSFKEWLERAEARRASLKKHYAETGATKHESGGNPQITGFANKAEASAWALKRLPKGLKHKIEEVPNPGNRARKFTVKWRGKSGESARLGEHLKARVDALVGRGKKS